MASGRFSQVDPGPDSLMAYSRQFCGLLVRPGRSTERLGRPRSLGAAGPLEGVLLRPRPPVATSLEGAARPEPINHGEKATASKQMMDRHSPSESREAFLCREARLTAADGLQRLRDSDGDGEAAKEALRSGCNRFAEVLIEGNVGPKVLLAVLTGFSDMVTASGLIQWAGKQELELISRMALVVAAKVENFSGSELVIVVNCFGKLMDVGMVRKAQELGVARMLSLVSIRLEVELVELQPVEVCGVVTSLARLGFRYCGDLLRAVIGWMTPRVAEVSASDLAALAWSMGHLHVPNSHMLMRAVSRRAKARLQEFTPEELCIMMWGMAEVEFKCSPALPQAVAADVVERFSAFTASELANVTWSLARLAVHPGEEFLSMVAAVVEENIHSLRPQSILRYVRAFGVAGFHHADLMCSAKRQLKSNLSAYKPQEIACFLQALAFADALDAETCSAAISHLAELPLTSLSWKARLHLYQSILHVRLLEKDSHEVTVPKSLEALCWSEWEKAESKRKPLKVMASVKKTFKKMGCKLLPQTVTRSFPFNIFCIEAVPGERIGIEVVAPFHCFANDRRRLTAPREWYVRAVGASGVPVLLLREEEWNNVPEESRERYLQRKLSESNTSQQMVLKECSREYALLNEA